MVNLKVLYFASVREITEKSEESLCLKVKEGNDELTTSELVQILLERYPKLQEIIDSVVVAVNMNYIDKGTAVRLREDDEVALIPPIGGG